MNEQVTFGTCFQNGQGEITSEWPTALFGLADDPRIKGKATARPGRASDHWNSGTNAVLPASLAPLSHTGLPAVHPECQAHTCPGSFALAGHFRAARPLHLPTASSSFRSPVRCPLLREAAHTVPAGTATFAHPWSCALRHPHFVPFTAQPTMACEPKPAHSLLLYSP